MLAESSNGIVILGNDASRHPAAATVRALAAAIAEMTGCTIGFVSEGPNSAGACLAGLLPHRAAGGKEREQAGKNVSEMLDDGLDALLLFGLEPDRDIDGEDVVSRLSSTAYVAAVTSYDSEALRQTADLLLPLGTFAETSGTFVNCEGRWQSFGGISNPVGESRPGWKILRVLGNLLDAPEFDYQTSEEVRDELKHSLGDVAGDNTYRASAALPAYERKTNGDARASVPMYGVDPVVRRARALQLTPEARRAATGAYSR
jgi:NADH-quinone oxidoreductase subunit G